MKTETMQWTRSDIDRSNWGPGPWDGVQWQDEATGLPCLIVRSSMGNLCGYVGVAPGHPWHGRDYDGGDLGCEVHGGLTFSAACQETPGPEFGICHVGEEGVWWFGFDCAHDCDQLRLILQDTYRTVDYVQRECARLARQLAAVVLP